MAAIGGERKIWGIRICWEFPYIQTLCLGPCQGNSDEVTIWAHFPKNLREEWDQT